MVRRKNVKIKNKLWKGKNGVCDRERNRMKEKKKKRELKLASGNFFEKSPPKVCHPLTA